MKSHFGAVRMETVRKWTTPELRNYGLEAGLYPDAAGIYTLLLNLLKLRKI